MVIEFAMLIALVMALATDIQRFVNMHLSTKIDTLRWAVSVEGRWPSHPMLYFW